MQRYTNNYYFVNLVVEIFVSLNIFSKFAFKSSIYKKQKNGHLYIKSE